MLIVRELLPGSRRFTDLLDGLLGMKITASSAATTGALTVAGDPQAAERLGKILSRNQVLAQAEAAIKGTRQQG